ncbi:hypothetical protein P5F33_09840 [Clostridium perfringens]|nr:hypothetical protein [Clostridium perfringens]HAT4214918.1 hypothetical protein [Clostridium perfringens]
MKNTGVISVFIGILVNLFLFTKLGSFFNTVIPIILIGVLGICISVISIINSDKKVVGVIGGLINLIPLAYFFILLIGIG